MSLWVKWIVLIVTDGSSVRGFELLFVIVKNVPSVEVVNVVGMCLCMRE